MSNLIWDYFVSYAIPGLVGGGFAWLIFAFLGQKFIEQRLAKDIKRFENQLSQKTEALKIQLSIYAHEQNIVATTALILLKTMNGMRLSRLTRLPMAISQKQPLCLG